MKKLLGGKVPAAAGIVTVAVLAAGGGYAVAGSSDTIGVCVSKSSGVLYRGKCHKHDGTLSWNVSGPRGATGTGKAYGFIYTNGSGVHLDPARSKNITAVTEPSPGTYCVAVSGASPNTDVATATPWYGYAVQNPPLVSIVEVNYNYSFCPSGQYDFEYLDTIAIDGTVHYESSNGDFGFVIP